MAIYKNKVIKMRKKINKIKMGFFLKIEDSIKKLILIRIFKKRCQKGSTAPNALGMNV